MSTQALQARSLYRRFLRELPSRTPSILANPSPLQHHIRADFSSPSPDAQTPAKHSQSHSDLSATFRGPGSSSPSLERQVQKPAQRRLGEAEQYLHYLRAQRQYITLLERYNPGMNMNEEDRVRMTANRVGMNLPAEYLMGGGKGKRE